MITISLGGKEIVVRPKQLLDYVEKLDFIKARRQQPYDLLKDWPQEKGAKGAEAGKMLIQLAMETVYTRSSSVSIEEEICFDKSEEGFYFDLWRCIRTDPKQDWRVGINEARALFEKATLEEKMRLRMALEGTDETNNLKN
jgi:hypothetical protein